VSSDPRAMALDLGTRGVGWAWAGRSGQIRLDRFATRPIPDRWFAQADLLSSKLACWLEECRPGVLVIERPFFHRATPAAGAILYQLLGVAGVVAYRKELPVELATIFDWQAWARGEGWAKAEDDDANDAAWILRWWEAGAPVRLVKPRKAVARRDRQPALGLAVT
jgi:Holliday junction resolvasome RuvABC endonuclease subunit